jgi:hypothetical protein
VPGGSLIGSCDARVRGRVSSKLLGATCAGSSAPSLRFNPTPPRTSQKSCRPRVSHRIMVGTLANRSACVASGAEGVEHHRVMKPSSGNHRLGWSRWNTRRAPDGQDQNPSRTEMGLDASDNIHVSSEGRGKNFFLTSRLIGQLTRRGWPSKNLATNVRESLLDG